MDEQTQWIIGLSITLLVGLAIAVGMHIVTIYNSSDRKKLREERNKIKMIQKEKQKLNKINLDGMEIVTFADYYLPRLNARCMMKEYRAVLTRFIPKTVSKKATSDDKRNISKRYVPFDHNMVSIGTSKKDYINASWMPGFGNDEYIATQVPLQTSIWDFWKMIWMVKCPVIVMIGEEISNAPELFDYTNPGAYTNPNCPFSIFIEKTYTAMDFKIQKIRLTKAVERTSRVLTHIQFLTWTNIRTTKPQVILELRRQMKKVKEYAKESNWEYEYRLDKDPESQEHDKWPVVVHCISGCGRTGTFISIANLCDVVDKYKEDRTDEKISVPHEVIRMRENRIMSVANLVQYNMIYEALIHYIVGGVTAIPTAYFQEEMSKLSVISPHVGVTRFHRQYMNIKRLTAKLQFSECAGGIRDENIEKNRDPLIIPRDSERPYLKNVKIKGTSDYINAVYIDSFTVKSHFIVTQWPKMNTINDVWRLLFDKNIQVMILLNVFEKDRKYHRFWPTIMNQPTGSGTISVELIEDEMVTNAIRCQIFNLSLINFEIKLSDISLLQSKGVNITKKYSTDKMSWKVTIFHLLNWRNTSQVPEELYDVINLIWLSEEFNASSGFSPNSRSPIVVMSEDGVKRAGVYCAVATCLERMRFYGDVDVYSAVMNVKRSRPELINTLEEYLLCYEICLEYLNWSENKELSEVKDIDIVDREPSMSM